MRCVVRPMFAMAAWASLVFLAGCGSSGPELFPVSGTVTVNGKPLPTGSVQFIGTGLRPAYGQIGADGKFKLATDDQEGCAAGTFKVVVSAQEVKGTEATGEIVVPLAPERYASVEKTNVEVTIDGPKSDLVIDLKGEVLVENTP